MHLLLVDVPTTKPQADSNKKHKGKAEDLSSHHDAVSHNNKKTLKAHPNPEHNNGVEVDVSDDNEQTRVKKQKTSTGYVAMPLRRTG